MINQTYIKMHTDELSIDESLVWRLLSRQFPQWQNLPLKRLPSSGTDNVIYRLGDSLVVRMPRIYWAVEQVELEHEWLPKLAPQLSLPVPVPVAKGQPSEEYPWQWSVYEWLDGENLTIDEIAHPSETAKTLAEFILSLQKISTVHKPVWAEKQPRGKSLSRKDEDVRIAIKALEKLINVNQVTEIWNEMLQIPEWDRPAVWFHGDLMSGNLIFRNRILSAVIDFSCLGVGDPACDLMIAWNLLSGTSRETFKKALQVDDATWARGRGHALSQALIFLPYYLNTNPLGVKNAWRTLKEVLDDYSL